VVAAKLAARFVGLWLCAAALAGERPPFTYLYDVGASGGAAFPSRAATGSSLPEGQLAHEFKGRALLLNNKLALSVGHGGARLYAWVGSRWERRGSLEVIPGETLRKLAAAENSRSAVAVDAAFGSRAGGASSVRFRLTAGAAYAEIRAGQGTRGLRLRFPRTACVVVPDLLAGDVAYLPGFLPTAPKLGLPAENCLLAFLGQGRAICVLTWKSPSQDADLLVAPGSAGPAISGLEIACREGQSVWVACLETPGIWRKVVGVAEVARLGRWKPPFPAKWRADAIRRDGTTLAWDLAGQPPAGLADAAQVVVYPLDRSRETPLTVFCPIDILRETLGTGPCEYILAVEGLGSPENPTPDDVTRWVERLFERGRAAKNADLIRERLDLMCGHVERTLARIAEYEKFAAGLRALCRERSRERLVRRLLVLLDELERQIADGRRAAGSLEETKRLARRLGQLAVARGPAEEAQGICERLRATGAALRTTLARCRLAARRIEQWARTAERTGGDTALARKVQRRAKGILGTKGRLP